MKRPHVLVFPLPLQGHMIPLLDLSLSLAPRGLALTLLTTPENEPLLRPLLSTASSQDLFIQSLIISLPPPTHGLTLNEIQLPHLIYSQKGLADPLEQWLLQQKLNESSDEFGPVICIISDFFLGWTQDTATKVGIPRVVFSPSGAFAISVISSLWKYMPHLGVESDDGEVPIPGFPHPLTLRKFQLSPLAQAYESSDPVHEFIKYIMNLNIQSWGALINTFYSLETPYVDHLRTISGRPVWSVGPLLPPAVFHHEQKQKQKQEMNPQRGNPNSINEALCLQWLDCRKEKSVVYVCFGSLATLSEKQNEEIASGLEASGESFIWVIRDNENDKVGISQSYEERVKEKGLIIRGWAPQLLILSHPSVGCFVTHCGWNSTLESITLGIPMIAWPLTADQHSDALLLVEYLRVAVRLCEGLHVLPNRDLLASAVKRVVGGQGEEGMRVQELSRAAREAVKQGGSSSSNLEVFVACIQNLAHDNL
ncbi:hypothetical protein SUGI_0740490 [Cryptomeria japonica]|uniref:UDP-glycosyltransferase 89B2 n=1 Tax=Cryptomeria japonica TaxID=3369 RepID=UPI002414A2D4|nr:UDP-glycosyltransferase 89B2 [Cryptomeria japonica]GLJ36762.1 hypothetical protein SUGI_0740490 [Cryptomeria japonica]